MPLGNGGFTSSGCINFVSIVFCIYRCENGSTGSSDLHPWRSSQREARSSIRSSTWSQRGDGHAQNDSWAQNDCCLSFSAVIFPCLVLSAFSLCESTSFPKSTNVSSKKLIIFASDISCMSLSLILNYSWEVDSVVPISACLMESETYWVKFSKFASPVAMMSVSRKDRLASHQVKKGKLSVEALTRTLIFNYWLLTFCDAECAQCPWKLTQPCTGWCTGGRTACPVCRWPGWWCAGGRKDRLWMLVCWRKSLPRWWEAGAPNKLSSGDRRSSQIRSTGNILQVIKP